MASINWCLLSWQLTTEKMEFRFTVEQKIKNRPEYYIIVFPVNCEIDIDNLYYYNSA